jgi:hypothetical protein
MPGQVPPLYTARSILPSPVSLLLPQLATVGVLASTVKFDQKKDTLTLILTEKHAQVDQLWNSLLSCWRMSLAFEQ